MATTGLGVREFPLTLGGQSYVLTMTLGAIAHAQNVLRTEDFCPTVEQIDKALKQGSLLHLRALIYGGLRKHHAGITLDDVDTMLEAVTEGEAHALLQAYGFATSADPGDLAELAKDAKANPPTAQGSATRGRSARSTSKRAASV